MARFKYVAMDAKGKETSGEIEAESESKAVAAIKTKGLFPTKLSTVGAPAQRRVPGGAPVKAQVEIKAQKKGVRLRNPFASKVKTRHLMVLTRQLATLVAAGMPLLRGLRILLKQEAHPALREALSGMGESIQGGSTFSESLAQYPHIFDRLYVNMVKAGEAGGMLEVVLRRLAEFMEKSEQVKGKIKGAMIYPVVVLCAAVGILIFMLLAVIPKFEEIFRDMLGGKHLPVITQFVIGLSNLVKQHFLAMAGVVFVAVVVFKTVGRTEKGRYLYDQMKLRAPLFGSLVSKTAIARFGRTLGTLMSNGVPLLQALMIVRDTSGNEVVAKAITQIHDSVKEGESMSSPMESTGLFPAIVISMVDVGEETGKTPEMLIKVADSYEEEVDRAVDGLTSVIEPIMIIMLAVIIGTIVIAMFLPMISIITQMSSSH